jgi:hypothetical protein
MSGSDGTVFCDMPTAADVLSVHQHIVTSGARAVEVFNLDGALRLAIPQLAEDIPDQPPHMNGGNSDISAKMFVWRNGGFVEDAPLALPGGEDIEYFTIDGQSYLATASLRTGRGPYDLNTQSVIYHWNAGAWEPFQSIATFAAKQWRHFSFDGRHFLALALGVTVDGLDIRHPATSRIYEWDGSRFAEFQVLDGKWGYNWTFFELNGMRVLAYADHAGASRLYRWDGAHFVALQDIGERAGRAFAFFEADGAHWLVYAPIVGETTLMRWDGDRFIACQSLGGDGGRELEIVTTSNGLFLVRICFIQGTPHDPKTALSSQVSRWQNGAFQTIAEFPTTGGTDATAFRADGALFLAVSNGLSADVRYRAETIVYRCAL